MHCSGFIKPLKACSGRIALTLTKIEMREFISCFFAVHGVVQETARLVFADSIHGPLKQLKENWMCGESQNLLDYFSAFPSQLHWACEVAKENPVEAQNKMKSWFDRKASNRQLQSGDKVLVFLPVAGSSLQAHYSGSYVVEHKINYTGYIIATPDRTHRSHLCHINMLKQYHE